MYLHPPRSRKPILATKLKRTSMEGVGQALQQGRPSIGDCSSIFQHHVDWCSTVPSPSAPSWLDFSDQTPGSGLHHRDFEPWWCTPAQQRIGTDEVHADGAGPSPLNSVLNAPPRGPASAMPRPAQHHGLCRSAVATERPTTGTSPTGVRGLPPWSLVRL